MIPAPVLSLAEASREIAAGHLSASELVEASLARIEALDPSLHAFIEIAPERARAAAKADAETAEGTSKGLLHGIPYALKDLYNVSGMRTTCHSRVLLDNVAKSDASATERLDGAGMAFMGKLSTHEFATGTPSPELPFPNARNPWNGEYFAGGSSSGSGVAVASGMVPLAMGTDTGGSIRLPAAYCGIVGLKPTYGRLSRHGIVPLSVSLDTAGPLARTVEDCALAMQVLAGYDPRDPACADQPVPNYMDELPRGVAGLRIGYARDFNTEAGATAEQVAALDAAAALLTSLGAVVEEIVIPARARFDAAGWIVTMAEAYAVHQKDLQQRPQDYATPTRERLFLGAFVTGPNVVRAHTMRRNIMLEVDRLMQRYDAILVTPTSGHAPLLEKVETTPLRRDLPLTILFNTTGHPAITLPCGFSENGLPLSFQLASGWFAEARLMRIAHAYEQAAGWHLKRPPL